MCMFERKHGCLTCVSLCRYIFDEQLRVDDARHQNRHLESGMCLLVLSTFHAHLFWCVFCGFFAFVLVVLFIFFVVVCMYLYYYYFIRL